MPTSRGKNPKALRSIAVDPGYDRVGISVFEGTTLLHSECFIPPKGEFSERLYAVFKHVRVLIKKYRPASLALETLFFTKNQKTAMKVAEARGVIQLAASGAGLAIVEYSPQSVKIAVTGSGNAPKEGVIRMVERLVPLGKKNSSTGLRVKRLDDEYDAIALGLAHVHNQGFFGNIHKNN